MKNRKIAIILGAGFIALTVIVIFLLSPSTENTIKKYMESWNKKDYAAMYKLLSDNSRSKYTEEAYTSKYQKISDGIGLTRVEVKNIDKGNIKSDDKGRKIVPFSLLMETGGGKIEFLYRAALVRSGLSYKIDWDEGLIFPNMTEGDTVGVKQMYGLRGEILDRNGRKLAENGRVYSAGFKPGKIVDREDAEKQFSKITGVPVEDIEKALNQKWVKEDSFVPVFKFSMEDTNIKNQLLTIKGVMIGDTPSRIYPYKDAAAHLTGYVGAISKEELEKLKPEGYGENDIIGKTGLERSFEKRLKAQNGLEIYIKNSKGEKKETVSIKEPKNGEDIKLTIDIDIQQALYGELNKDSGAAAAINPKTGEVFAMVSSPSYNPNRFVLGISKEEYNLLNTNPKKPLVSKYAGAYVPGSSFKPITAAIGLKTGTIKPDYKMDVKGTDWKDNPSWGSYSVTRVKDSGSPVDLRNAFIYSDNIYFAKAALDIGPDNFINESKNFGIGEGVDFPLSIATSQLIDKEGFKDKRGTTLADTGYGQGKVLISPVQLAYTYTPFVNDGNMVKPVLEDKSEKSKVWHENIVSSDIAKLILDDLTQVIDDPKGTGNGAKISGIPLAGKTGTAEIKGSKDDATGTELGWFTLMNTKEPRLLITMMIEDVKNRGGSHYVIPKVKSVMERFVK